ncbi:MAG: hypothetical protein KF799_16405 [Bdellovibrionales bacterium]|nr:hypothetical protein [Bdellovibrionales bacterium]
MRNWILILLCGWLVVGCSNQWREGEPDRTPEEVVQFLGELQSTQGSGFTGGDLSAALKNQESATIYFADAPSNVALVPNLLAFKGGFGWMGAGAEQFDYFNTKEARVFFLDNWETGEAGLIIGINQGSGYSYYAFSGTTAMDGDEYVATLTGGSGTIEVRSFDTEDGGLSDVVQLQIWVNDGGAMKYAGKISTLIGYY